MRLIFVIVEFKSRRIVGRAKTYEEGFADCIRRHEASGQIRSYFVGEDRE